MFFSVVFAAGDGDVPDPILPVLQEEHPPAGRSGPGLCFSGRPWLLLLHADVHGTSLHNQHGVLISNRNQVLVWLYQRGRESDGQWHYTLLVDIAIW